MTNDQKDLGYLLEILHATRKVPRTLEWIDSELRVIRGKVDTRALLDQLEDKGMVAVERDGLGIRRYTITAKGVDAWDAL